MGSSDVIARVKAEKGNPQCDVIWSIGGEQLEVNGDPLIIYSNLLFLILQPFQILS